MKDFKEAIEDEAKHISYNLGMMVDIMSAAYSCEDICNKRMIAFAEWISKNELIYTIKDGYFFTLYDEKLNATELLKIYKEQL